LTCNIIGRLQVERPTKYGGADHIVHGYYLASRLQGLQHALTSVITMVNRVDLDCPVHKSQAEKS